MGTIDIPSNEYPLLLRQIADPPKVLYFKGDWDTEIFSNTLGVVGSRKMTWYGETLTQSLIPRICQCGITIVSGFMYGIDATAHQTAVSSNGRTIAVMPCGIERVHPFYQKELYDSITATGGLIVSEYPGDTPPALWTYPRRNRIIAGLSHAILVIEAGLKSGALITSRIAMKYSKTIFAVPGPLTSSVSKGTNLLIKQGAHMVTEVDDILAYYNKGSKGVLHSIPGKRNVTPHQQKIIALLADEPLRIDEITRRTGIKPSILGSEITSLSLKKIITLRAGRYFLEQGESHAY